VFEVAIVRPGPIQGQMVHPYLRRRNGEEAPWYPNDEVKAVLEKTLGVPLFQEQAMQLAVVAAGFSYEEADRLRRAMAAWRRKGEIDQFQRRLSDGMLEKGMPLEFAERVLPEFGHRTAGAVQLRAERRTGLERRLLLGTRRAQERADVEFFHVR